MICLQLVSQEMLRIGIPRLRNIKNIKTNFVLHIRNYTRYISRKETAFANNMQYCIYYEISRILINMLHHFRLSRGKTGDKSSPSVQINIVKRLCWWWYFTKCPFVEAVIWDSGHVCKQQKTVVVQPILILLRIYW